MKIMKFGGTSVGNPDRMKALIPLINDDDRKIVVLSAMAGTTNSLVEITDLLNADSINEASLKNDELRAKYHIVADELYETDSFKKAGHELIDSHFEYIRNFTLRVFTKLQPRENLFPLHYFIFFSRKGISNQFFCLLCALCASIRMVNLIRSI
jgi:aspartate kinase